MNVAYRGLVTYTIVLDNSSPQPADDVLLTDVLPEEVDFSHWVDQPDGAAVVDEPHWIHRLRVDPQYPLSRSRELHPIPTGCLF